MTTSISVIGHDYVPHLSSAITTCQSANTLHKGLCSVRGSQPLSRRKLTKEPGDYSRPDNKTNDRTQNDDNKNFQPRIICKKDAEYAATTTEVSSLPGLAENIVQFDPKVQINCKGMKASSNDSPTSIDSE